MRLQRLTNLEREKIIEEHREVSELIARLKAILAEGYIERGIFHRKFMADAIHVAIASFHKIDYLVTWNFGHIANVRKQARLRLFNTTAGFFSPVIVTPEFLVHSI